MSPARTTNPLIAPVRNLDARTLRDIGLATDGSVIDEREPRFQRIPRRARAIGRLLAMISSPVAVTPFHS